MPPVFPRYFAYGMAEQIQKGPYMKLAFRTLVFSLALLFLQSVSPAPARAADLVWRHGIATIGELKYPEGFKRFDYGNPDAPKGGSINVSELGTYDTFNFVLDKGELPGSISMLYDTLLTPADDELSSSYGLLAEALSYPDDFSYAVFRLRPEAKFADGSPVTPADVVFSFEKYKELNPKFTQYYAHVTAAEVTGEREVTFRFDDKGNRELPSIVGQLPVISKAWWQANGPDGKPRDISKTSLEPPMASGPYKIAAFSPGSTITYELRDDYWAKDLNVNVGRNNFKTVKYSFFADRDVEFQAFKGHNLDWWWDNSAKRWATAYDFPAAQDGRIKREELENEYRKRGVMVGFIPNMRREQFKDKRVRQALNYAFDFEELNRTIFYNSYTRINSYFFGTELASSDLPKGEELDILDSVKDLVPPEVFTTPYTNPVGGDEIKERQNLRRAIDLFKQAGYEIRNRQMVNVKTGEPFTFEILLDGPIIERVALPYVANLAKIGIKATVRSVDASQFTNRLRAFDYDVVYQGWTQSMNPGNEQAGYWGSQSAERAGSDNYAGIADPGIDALIKKVIFAPNRDTLIAAVHALDRVLLAGAYVVPSYSRRSLPIAYWNNVVRPDNLPEYSMGFPDLWWAKSAEKK